MPFPFIPTSNGIYDWLAGGRQQSTADAQAVAAGVEEPDYTHEPAAPAVYQAGAPYDASASLTPIPDPTSAVPIPAPQGLSPAPGPAPPTASRVHASKKALVPSSNRHQPYAASAAAHGHMRSTPRAGVDINSSAARRKHHRQARRDFTESTALGTIEKADLTTDDVEARQVRSHRRNERAPMDYAVHERDYAVHESSAQPSTSSAHGDTHTAVFSTPVPAQPEPVVDDEQLYDEPMDLSEDEFESASEQDGAEVEDAVVVEDIGGAVPASDEAAASAYTGASVDDETPAEPSMSSTPADTRPMTREPVREEVDLYERLRAAMASGRLVDKQQFITLWERLNVHREQLRRRREELIADIRATRDVMEAVVDEETPDSDPMDLLEDEPESASAQDCDQGAEVEFDEDDEPFEDPGLARAEVDAGKDKGKGKDIDIDVHVHASASLHHDGVDASDEEAVVHRSVATSRAESADHEYDNLTEAHDDSTFASTSGSHDGAASTETDDDGGLHFGDDEFDASSADAPSPTSSDSSESTVRDTTPRPEERPTPMTEAQRAHAELLRLLAWVDEYDECTLRNRPPGTVISVICGSRAIETLKVERIVNENGEEDENGLVITVVDFLKRVRVFTQCDTGTLGLLYMAPSIYECKNVVLGDTLGHDQYYVFNGLQLPLATELEIKMTGTEDAQVWDLADKVVLDMPWLEKVRLSAAQRVTLPAEKILSFVHRNLTYECDCDPGCDCERNREVPVVRENVFIPGLKE
ncbi:hypothetical protein EXIGLDRAFT_751565 [Exidia glandulosa HHB12029]|uniref:Uncharacterized protein n=1 Tax=Exidia glandulosa HHB12029 TaxID=1314781 RepID=A0A165FAM5_EXIGL|nr:hypothetical protein EXIGLDRAFT_751565 [Exidia glandulosa HHB12029]